MLEFAVFTQTVTKRYVWYVEPATFFDDCGFFNDSMQTF